MSPNSRHLSHYDKFRLVHIEPRDATVDEVCQFHSRAYVDNVKALSDANGGDAGGLTPFGPGSFEIALRSAGGTIAAIDAVLDGTVDNCYALVRPPGHHAVADSGMGFCIFGNVAIGVHHARMARGLDRVAVIDWDVHHGNGTQAAFYEDPSVLTISLHQDNCFPPGSGQIGDTGSGPGDGYNINIPLPPGAGHGAYLAAFERVVLPAVRAFRPDLIVIASGFDASGMDPLGRQLLYSDSYRELTRLVMDVAGECCDGRLVMSHEGGYSPSVVPFCGLAVLEQMSGIRTAVEQYVTEVRNGEFPDEEHSFGKDGPPPRPEADAATEERLWENFEYFLRRVVPVAEIPGLGRGLHASDGVAAVARVATEQVADDGDEDTGDTGARCGTDVRGAHQQGAAGGDRQDDDMGKRQQRRTIPHDRLVARTGAIPFEHGELGMMQRRAFGIAEDARELE
jgi:acetoin utilization deacetylase AcuC-like enzyme